nr:hypothetical protein [Tanacetum cinerariifolium]
MVDLTGDEDPTDEDGDNGIGDPIGVLVSLEASYENFSYFEYLRTEDGGGAIGAGGGGIASPGNTFFDTSEDPSEDQLVPITVSPFSDDPYMKVMQAYYATNKLPIPPPPAPIAPPPSSVL